ncbi:hypothetical protein BC830DRAFT_741163 [Chytriomyces sp. MP71]|nr:hypothetical protein BC830DRAFT_741163 [Chytriomyces sp. MP71]
MNFLADLATRTHSGSASSHDSVGASGGVGAMCGNVRSSSLPVAVSQMPMSMQMALASNQVHGYQGSISSMRLVAEPEDASALQTQRAESRSSEGSASTGTTGSVPGQKSQPESRSERPILRTFGHANSFPVSTVTLPQHSLSVIIPEITIETSHNDHSQSASSTSASLQLDRTNCSQSMASLTPLHPFEQAAKQSFEEMLHSPMLMAAMSPSFQANSPLPPSPNAGMSIPQSRSPHSETQQGTVNQIMLGIHNFPREMLLDSAQSRQPTHPFAFLSPGASPYPSQIPSGYESFDFTGSTISLPPSSTNTTPRDMDGPAHAKLQQLGPRPQCPYDTCAGVAFESVKELQAHTRTVHFEGLGDGGIASGAAAAGAVEQGRRKRRATGVADESAKSAASDKSINGSTIESGGCLVTEASSQGAGVGRSHSKGQGKAETEDDDVEADEQDDSDEYVEKESWRARKRTKFAFNEVTVEKESSEDLTNPQAEISHETPPATSYETPATSSYNEIPYAASSVVYQDQVSYYYPHQQQAYAYAPQQYAVAPMAAVAVEYAPPLSFSQMPSLQYQHQLAQEDPAGASVTQLPTIIKATKQKAVSSQYSGNLLKP